MSEQGPPVPALRDRIHEALEAWWEDNETPDDAADFIVARLGLEQVGWMIWENPEHGEWITVYLDYEDLHHFPHVPFYRLMDATPSGRNEHARG